MILVKRTCKVCFVGFLFIILALFCARTESRSEQVVRLAPRQASKMLQYALECIRETDTDAAILVQIRNKKYTDDESIRKFFFCTFRKAGVSSKKGMVRVQKMLDIYPEDADKEALRKVIEECNKYNGTDPMDNVFMFFKCFQQNTPVRLLT